MQPQVAVEKNQTAFEPLLDPAAAAELLGVHEKTLVRMAREGKVPGLRVGKHWRFRVSMLDAWLENQVESGRQPDRSAEKIQ